MMRFTKLNWRITWYSVLLWVLAFLVASIVIIPWFYLVLPLVIFLTTFYYFRIVEKVQKRRGGKKHESRDMIFMFGLAAALFWFLIITMLNILQIAGFYYFDFLFYFSDFRNWYLYALILLVPVVYSLILENSQKNRRRKNSKSLYYGGTFILK